MISSMIKSKLFGLKTVNVYEQFLLRLLLVLSARVNTFIRALWFERQHSNSIFTKFTVGKSHYSNMLLIS